MRNRSSIASRMSPDRTVLVRTGPTNSLKEPLGRAHFQRALTQNLTSPHGTRENQCATC